MNHFLKFWLTILILSLFGGSLQAQWKLATINDPDGFTYVRSGKGTNFKSIATIKKNEFFYCEPTSFDWWKVNTIHDEEGYVHRSRINVIESLPDTSKRTLFLSVFKTQKDLADKYVKAWKSKDSITYLTTGKNLERHAENNYAPLLETFTKYFCKTGDTALLKQLFMTMWSDKGSADERPSFTLGDVFVCKPDVIVTLLRQLPIEQKTFIADDIKWGLLNHYNMNEDEKPKNKEYIQLKRKLDMVRK